MSGIRGKDTQPELVIRRGLHAAGFRYRLHVRTLPGRPDLVFPKYKAVLFVHGCFWHGHDCHLFKWPRTREDFWRNKIEGNVERDRKVFSELTGLGYRTGVVWECAIKGKARLHPSEVIEQCRDWLTQAGGDLELRGNEAGLSV